MWAKRTNAMALQSILITFALVIVKARPQTKLRLINNLYLLLGKY